MCGGPLLGTYSLSSNQGNKLVGMLIKLGNLEDTHFSRFRFDNLEAVFQESRKKHNFIGFRIHESSCGIGYSVGS